MKWLFRLEPRTALLDIKNLDPFNMIGSRSAALGEGILEPLSQQIERNEKQKSLKELIAEKM